MKTTVANILIGKQCRKETKNRYAKLNRNRYRIFIYNKD